MYNCFSSDSKGGTITHMYFMIKPLNIRTATYGNFVNTGKFLRANASDFSHVAWSWYKRIHAKSKPTRNEALTDKLLQ